MKYLILLSTLALAGCATTNPCDDITSANYVPTEKPTFENAYGESSFLDAKARCNRLHAKDQRRNAAAMSQMGWIMMNTPMPPPTGYVHEVPVGSGHKMYYMGH